MANNKTQQTALPLDLLFFGTQCAGGKAPADPMRYIS